MTVEERIVGFLEGTISEALEDLRPRWLVTIYLGSFKPRLETLNPILPGLG